MPCECKYCECSPNSTAGLDVSWGTVIKDVDKPAWSRDWVIINTLGTIFGAVTGLVALVVAVVALTS